MNSLAGAAFTWLAIIVLGTLAAEGCGWAFGKLVRRLRYGTTVTISDRRSE